MAETIFTRILAGDLPCYKLYEDDVVLAFLDINPLSEGHALLIPKEPAETLDRLGDEAAAGLGRVLPRLCRALIAATGTAEYNILQNNGPLAHQAVDHVHFHIIPRPSREKGLGLQWRPTPVDERAAKRIRDAVAEHLAAGV